jgi:hypothetical protein
MKFPNKTESENTNSNITNQGITEPPTQETYTSLRKTEKIKEDPFNMHYIKPNNFNL